ncbi:MAG: hypothetical protein Q8K59_00455 [Nitrosomonas sp.]|nr:hypothetical protein [Nitrosomonas sp.]
MWVGGGVGGIRFTRGARPDDEVSVQRVGQIHYVITGIRYTED